MSYRISFNISDTMISEPSSSIMVNYLYTGKPICVYDREEIYNYSKDILDYRKELWYKSAYSVFEKNDVLEFVKTVEKGEQYNELETYRNQVVKKFDGKVCERIYSFLALIRIAKRIDADIVLIRFFYRFGMYKDCCIIGKR